MVELRRVPAHPEPRDLLQPVLMLPCSSVTFLPWCWRTGVMSQSWRGARHIKKLFSAGLTGTGTESNIERPGVTRHFSLSFFHRYKGPGWCASPTGELNPQYLATVSACACMLYGSIGQRLYNWKIFQRYSVVLYFMWHCAKEIVQKTEAFRPGILSVVF